MSASGTKIWLSLSRNPSGLIVQRGSLSDSKERRGDATGSLGREERMSDWSCLASTRMEARSIGASRYVARRDAASCSLVNMGL